MKKFFKALSALTMALCLTATALIPTGTASARTNVIAQETIALDDGGYCVVTTSETISDIATLPKHIQSPDRRNTATTMQTMFFAGPTRFTAPLSTMEPHWFPARILLMRLPSTKTHGPIAEVPTGKAATPHMVRLHII